MSVLPDLLKTRQAYLALRNLLLKPIRLPRPAAQHRRCTAAWLAACGVRGFRGGRTALLYGADFDRAWPAVIINQLLGWPTALRQLGQ